MLHRIFVINYETPTEEAQKRSDYDNRNCLDYEDFVQGDVSVRFLVFSLTLIKYQL